jgi:hypothetical protein
MQPDTNMNTDTQLETKPNEPKSEHNAAQPITAGFIDEKELLTRLPVSRRTLWQWRATGKIPCVRVPGGRRVLFHWPSVEAALLRKQKGGV